MQHHQIGPKFPLEHRVTSSSWSSVGSRLILLTALSHGQVCAWNPPGASETCWTCHPVTKVTTPIGTVAESAESLHFSFTIHTCYGTARCMPSEQTLHKGR